GIVLATANAPITVPMSPEERDTPAIFLAIRIPNRNAMIEPNTIPEYASARFTDSPLCDLICDANGSGGRAMQYAENVGPYTLRRTERAVHHTLRALDTVGRSGLSGTSRMPQPYSALIKGAS